MYFKIPVTSSAAFNHGSFFLKHPHIGELSKIFFFKLFEKSIVKEKKIKKSSSHSSTNISRNNNNKKIPVSVWCQRSGRCTKKE